MVWSAKVFQIPNSIQLRDRLFTSRGSGRDSVPYITDSDGNLKVFNVERNDSGLWLNSYYDNPDNVWNGNNRWVFARRKLLRSPLLAGFILKILATHQAFFRFRLIFQIGEYIFCYPTLLSPKRFARKTSVNQVWQICKT